MTPSGSRPELDALLDQTDHLAARPRTVEELPGGLTNRNYKVTTPDGTFVARIALGGTELLAIDRDNEYRNSVTAAAAGVGAPVIEYRPQDRLLVLGYLEGRTLASADVADERNIPRIAQACRRLHAGGRFGNDFDMFDIQRGYLAVARSRGFRIPAGYEDLLPPFSAAEQALAARANKTVPCHNDLLAANFLGHGDRLVILDWEYAGMNDRYFDLGNLATNNGFSAADETALLDAYFADGVVAARRRARLALMKIMSDFREAMWGVVQQGISALDHDYVDYAATHFDRLLANASTPGYRRLLAEAAQPE